MKDLFAHKAKDWDKLDRRQQLSIAIATTIIDRVPFNDTMHVMDFGAGTGLLTAPIASRVASVTAVDTSQSMLTQLMAKPELSGNVEAVHQNILTAPLEQRFDVIVSAMTMHHVEDTAALAQTLALHTKPGATIALADLDAEDGHFHPPEAEGVFHPGFDRKALGQHLTHAGFENLEFMTAHTVDKGEKAYPIFLVTGTRAG